MPNEIQQPACSNCANQYRNLREMGVTHPHGKLECLEKQHMPRRGICDQEKYKIRATYGNLVDLSNLTQQST